MALLKTKDELYQAGVEELHDLNALILCEELQRAGNDSNLVMTAKRNWEARGKALYTASREIINIAEKIKLTKPT